MKNWEDYKKTAQTISPLFQWAKEGLLSEIINNPMSLSAINSKNSSGHSALMLAAYHDHYEVCRYLLSMGADPHSIDLGGNTILMGVAFKGHLEIAQLLIQNGADLDQKNQKGQTALDFAQMFGRTEMVKFLKAQKHEPASFNYKETFVAWIQFFKKQFQSN